MCTVTPLPKWDKEQPQKMAWGIATAQEELLPRGEPFFPLVESGMVPVVRRAHELTTLHRMLLWASVAG